QRVHAGRGKNLPSIAARARLIAACTGLAYGVAAHGRPFERPMSVRAELLRLALRLLKKRHIREQVGVAAAPRRVEPFVPRPPAGTQTTAIDAGGVNAVTVAARQARSDRCVLYFHGGAYAVGTAKLLRDFTWRIGAAARAHVLYFDYRLAPEHPFPAALEDAVSVYRWLAGRVAAPRLPFIGASA